MSVEEYLLGHAPREKRATRDRRMALAVRRVKKKRGAIQMMIRTEIARRLVRKFFGLD